ncbi:hypothetical protein PHYSODRAFT_497265 [Phytophthora sojae]|uniref:Uncharacterized protein n=1 Tax=Phytophthora sojae (strain P6497) TaxID=1094619 RepID=G4Z8J0_PHYSP|nr:hypothetical protein PHYSODRAFT_497265 [Phytophthora sojae]EGZ22541.1 hypothetical protein PHYSODRAFT_497265 [Phytophthora sojae]|eukprot:XP_009525258.1 hypothetical protein PHYSODRAFT_497265 [Phytophthora sojae]
MVYSGGVRSFIQAVAVCALALSALPSIQAKGATTPAPTSSQVTCGISDGDKQVGIQAINDESCTNGGLGCYNKHCRYCKVLDTPKSSHLDTCLSHGVAFTTTSTVAASRGPCEVSRGDVAAGIAAVTDSGCLYGGLGCFNDHCRFCKVRETPQSAGFIACARLDSSYSPVATLAPATAAPTVPPTAAPTSPPTAAPTSPPTAAPTVPPTAAATAPPTTAPATLAPTTDAPVTEAPISQVPITDAPTSEAPATEAPTSEAPVTDAPTVPPMDAPATAAPSSEVPATDAPVSPSTCGIVPSAGDLDVGVTIVTDLSCASGGLGCLSDVCRFCKLKTTPQSDPYMDCALVNGAPTATEIPATTDAPSATSVAAETDAPVTDAPTDAPISTDAPTDAPISTDAPADAPISTDAPTDAPISTDVATDAPTSTDAPTDAPQSTDAPVAATEAPAPAVDDTVPPSDAPTEVPDSTSEAPAATTETPAAPTEAPATVTDTPDATTEAPPTVTDTDAPTETPAVPDALDASTEAPTEAPTATETPAPSESPAAPTDAPDATTEPVTGSETPTESPVVPTGAPVSTSAALPDQQMCGLEATAGDIAVGVHIATDLTCSTGGVGCINDLCRFCKVKTTPQSEAFVDCSSLDGTAPDSAAPASTTSAPLADAPSTCDLVASSGDASVGIQIVTDSTCSAGGVGCINDVCRFCKVITSVQSASFIDCVTVDGYTPPTEIPTATTTPDATTTAPTSDSTCARVASVGDIAVGVDIATDTTCLAGGVGCMDDVCRFCQVTSTAQSAAFVSCTSLSGYTPRVEVPASNAIAPAAPATATTGAPADQPACGLVVSAGDAAVGISITGDATCADGGVGCIDSVCRFCKVTTTVQSAAFVDCTSIDGFTLDTDAPTLTTTPPTASTTSAPAISTPGGSCSLVVSDGDAAVGINIFADTSCQFGGVGCIDNACRFCKTKTTDQSAAFVDCPVALTTTAPTPATPYSNTTVEPTTTDVDTATPTDSSVNTEAPVTTDAPAADATEAPSSSSSDVSDILTYSPASTSADTDVVTDAPTAVPKDAPVVDTTSPAVVDTSDMLTEAPVVVTEPPTKAPLPSVDDIDDDWEGSDSTYADSDSTYYDSEESEEGS